MARLAVADGTRGRVLRPLVVAALTVAPAACGKEIESKAGPDIRDATPVSLGPTTSAAGEENRYRTHLYSERDADVYTRWNSDESGSVGALVKAIHVEIGDRVAAGQLLATLEDDQAAIDVEATGARAEEARANFRRVQELREKQLASASEYEAALSAMRSAEADLRRAQLRLSWTRVRPPFGGVVARRYVRVGERVEEGKPLFRVTAMSPLRARLLVPEDRAAAFRIGSPVRLTGAQGVSGQGHVLLVSPTVDPASGTREVIVELAQPGDFLPGAAVIAELIAGREGAGR